MRKASHTPDMVFAVAQEMLRDNGEDCYCYDVQKDGFLLASLDGCGGSGGKQYNNYSGKTGAYIASRAVCGSIMDWFQQSRDPSTMTAYIQRALAVCKSYADQSGVMMGSLSKSFPTTLAMMTGKPTSKQLEFSCYWAGDSRCYLLDATGLHQLTSDDLDNQDAMSNLTNDGVMTNVINGSTPFEIHQKNYLVTQPSILITATDGCFGYLNSPMEFEHLLLDTLLSSPNPAGWKNQLHQRMYDVAGDDFTLCVAAYGFGDFSAIQQHFLHRADFLNKQYILPDVDVQFLWEHYKKDYSAYL